MAYERLKGKSATVPGSSHAEGNLVAKETSRWPSWKVDVHAGRWHAFGHQSNHGREVIVEKPERRVAHKDGLEKDSEGKMGPKQSGYDRGPVAQERRRCQDGERLKGEVVMMDEDWEEKLEMEEHVPVPKKESVHNTRRLGGVRVSQRNVLGACRCAKGPRDKRAQKTVQGGLKRS